MVGVGNQHSSNTAEISIVKIKSAEKAGQAYMKMRSTQRGRALWDTYKLGKPRERIVLFTMKEMCDATIGTF